MSEKSPAQQLKEIAKAVQDGEMVRAEAQPEPYWEQIWAHAQKVAATGKTVIVMDLDILGMTLRLNMAEQAYWKRFLAGKGFYGVMCSDSHLSFGWM